MYNVQCTAYNVQRAMYSVQSTLYNVQCTMYIAQRTTPIDIDTLEIATLLLIAQYLKFILIYRYSIFDSGFDKYETVCNKLIIPILKLFLFCKLKNNNYICLV